MKKMLLMAGVAAMAFGAQARTVIQPVSPDNDNTTLFENTAEKTGITIVQGVSGSVDAYPYTWTVTLTDVADASRLPKLTAYLVNTAEEREGAAGYYVYTSMVIDDSNVTDQILAGSDKVTATKVFYSTKEITYKDANLATVLVASDAAGNELGRQTLATTYSSESDHTTLGANGTYTATSNVPEPTSSLLVLLGVAGLALKRKRAA